MGVAGIRHKRCRKGPAELETRIDAATIGSLRKKSDDAFFKRFFGGLKNSPAFQGHRVVIAKKYPMAINALLATNIVIDIFKKIANQTIFLKLST
jgi:hypothetical protein